MRMRINRNYLSQVKDRPLTTQRRLLLETLREAKGHVDARELYQRAINKDPQISLATVYRNLRLFKELGLVDERRLDDMHCYYEMKRSTEHHHMVCTTCRRVIEFESPLVNKLMDEVQRSTGFDVVRAVVYFEGYCPDCRQQGRKP
jgi:Fur family ferric uptake transcriptional regulator